MIKGVAYLHLPNKCQLAHLNLCINLKQSHFYKQRQQTEKRNKMVPSRQCWTFEKTKLLISTIKENPILQSNQTISTEFQIALANVGRIMKIPKHLIRAKISSLKRYYRKLRADHLRKNIKPNWQYYDLMAFFIIDDSQLETDGQMVCSILSWNFYHLFIYYSHL